MAIVKPLEERVDEAVRQGPAHVSLEHSLSLGSVLAPCSRCNEPIDKSEPMWFWMLSTGPIKMHLKCFLNWLPRVMLDYYKAWKIIRSNDSAND